MEYGRQSDPWSWGGDDNGDGQQNECNNWSSNTKQGPPMQNYIPQGHSYAHPNGKPAKPPQDFYNSFQPNSHPSLNHQEYRGQNPYQEPRNDGQIYTESSPGNYNNNNTTASEVENKEVAPPDNKFSRNHPPSGNNAHRMPLNVDTTHFTALQNPEPFIPPHQNIQNSFQQNNFDTFNSGSVPQEVDYSAQQVFRKQMPLPHQMQPLPPQQMQSHPQQQMRAQQMHTQQMRSGSIQQMPSQPQQMPSHPAQNLPHPPQQMGSISQQNLPPQQNLSHPPQQMTSLAHPNIPRPPQSMTPRHPQQMISQPSQQMTGQSPQQMTGQSSQQMTGHPQQITGQSSQQMTGQPPQQMTGQPPLQMTGQPPQQTAQPLQQMTGQPPQQMSGQPPLQMTGQPPQQTAQPLQQMTAQPQLLQQMRPPLSSTSQLNQISNLKNHTSFPTQPVQPVSQSQPLMPSYQSNFTPVQHQNVEPYQPATSQQQLPFMNSSQHVPTMVQTQQPNSFQGFNNYQPMFQTSEFQSLETKSEVLQYQEPMRKISNVSNPQISSDTFEEPFQQVSTQNHYSKNDAFLSQMNEPPVNTQSKMTELSHKRSESLPQNFQIENTNLVSMAPNFDKKGSQQSISGSYNADPLGYINSSSHPSSSSSDSLQNSISNSFLSINKTNSISANDIQQDQTSRPYNLEIKQQSASMLPPMTSTAPQPLFEQNVTQISQSYSYANLINKNTFTTSNPIVRPMASSSPHVAHIPENLERPENHEHPESEDLNMQMKSLTINTDMDKQSQVLCSIDRNQYLETGQLSNQKESNDAFSNIETLDEGDAPPPGLDRLVTGQVCESRINPSDQQLQMENLTGNDSTRQSTPLSFMGDHESRQRHSGTEGESEGGGSRRTRLVQGQSIGDDTDGREIPGEDDPTPSRVVLGQIGSAITPPIQDSPTPRSDREVDREMGRRMVVGEQAERDQQRTGNVSDDYRQKHGVRHRHHRGESSFDEDERDFDSDRDRRNEEYKRRDERNRRRREHRSPEYRSDEEYDDRRPYHRRGRNDRDYTKGRPRDYNSPERDYRDYNRDFRDEHRRYRRYDHYNRDYDEEYYRENRSRPSSRTGSDYRRNMDYSMRNPMQRYHDHTMNSSGYVEYNRYSAVEYYEKMRQTDPVRYAAWYEQYMKERYNTIQHSVNYGTDRASVHSGQSAFNQRHVQTPQIMPDRSTRPTDDEYDIRLFSTNHIKGKLDGQGRLLVIDPNHPLDGQRATINLYRLAQPLLDSDTEEFFESPGPFIPGVTHRNTVLQYLKKISEKATKSSEKLLYDLIHLTVKGNGEVNEVDVAELLMNSYKKSEKEERGKSEESPVEKLPEKEVVAKFRELLQQGNKTEALEWAIDHGAWGHALFLASKMDDKTHNQIMLRFANSIPHNDPLQTLYQLMSGHIPQSSTCCADKKWSDWRPHLAMILGNPTRNPTLDRKAIIRLGDSLNAHGRLFASHFCYVTAQVEFSHFKSDAKLVLLGSSPNQDFSRFATCRAIMVTMCYEYGLKLRQRDFSLPTLQLYKLLLAMRLIDNGKSKNALQYCEMLANEAVQVGQTEKALISDVIDVSSRLKMLDPTLALSGETDNDPDWLYKLKCYHNDLPENHDMSLKISHGISSSTISEVGQDNSQHSQVDPILEAHDNLKYNDPYASYNPDLTLNHLIPSQPTMPQQIPTNVIKEEQTFQPNYMMNPPMQLNSYQEPATIEPAVQADSYWSDNSNMGHMNTNYAHQSPEMIPPVNNSNNFFKSSEEQLKLNEVAPTSDKPEVKQSDNKSKNDEQRSGWFGGIWDKLSMRPKNQMRLPDDSNPSIVWDQEKKKWVNLDGDDESTNAVKPPPRAVEMNRMSNNVNPAPAPSTHGGPTPQGPPQQNKYKLQKGKLMKSNYVNVMGGSKDKDGPSSLGNLPPLLPNAPVQNNFFIPPPVDNENAPVDFITPASMNPTLPESLPESNKQQIHQGAPMMYNPTKFPS